MDDTSSSPSQNLYIGSIPKPSKWRYLFIVLGILQLLGVGMFFAIMSWAIGLAKAGNSGTEFIGLVVFAFLVPLIGLIALINLIGLPVYMHKHKPKGKGLFFSITSLSFSLLLFLFGAYSIIQLRVVVPARERQFTKQLQQDQEAKQREFVADNSKPEITEAEAIDLLRSCKLKGFYYTNQTSKSDGNWGELSSTGVVFDKNK